MFDCYKTKVDNFEKNKKEVNKKYSPLFFVIFKKDSIFEKQKKGSLEKNFRNVFLDFRKNIKI